MTPANNQSVNLLIGRWRIVSLYANVVGRGWTLFKRYTSNSTIWELTEEKTLDFPSGNVSFKGRLTEHMRGQEEALAEYAYFPQHRELFIDRSEYGEGGTCTSFLNDRYRVEQINPSYLWLYELEEVKNEPEDYRFRIKLKRI